MANISSSLLGKFSYVTHVIRLELACNQQQSNKKEEFLETFLLEKRAIVY